MVPLLINDHASSGGYGGGPYRCAHCPKGKQGPKSSCYACKLYTSAHLHEGDVQVDRGAERTWLSPHQPYLSRS